MYYLIKGKCNDDYCGCWEWIVKAGSKEDAINDAKKDLTNQDEITDVIEITAKQCIERELEDIKKEIKRQYLISHYDYENVPIKRYNEIKKEFEKSPDNLYEAIKEANKKLRLLRRVKRIVDIENLKLKDIRDFLSEAVKAETEEQLNDIINKIKEVK